MNDANTRLRLLNEMVSCSYPPNMKDYLANIIMQTMNYQNQQGQPRHFIKNMDQNKIIMVWLPMSIPFSGRKYSVPLQIFFMRNLPYEPPQIFIEIVTGSAVNSKNTDIDANTRRIMTNSLRNWNQYSTIDNVLNEIYNSFCKTFPVYKLKTNQQQPNQQSNSIYNNNNQGNFYNNLNKANNPSSNMNYQNNNNNNNAYQRSSATGPGSFYQAPTSFYGQNMSNSVNMTGGGGIYGQNNQNNNYGQGGIYGQNNYNNQGYNNMYQQNNNSGYMQNSGYQPKYQGSPYTQNVYNQQFGNPNDEFKKVLINCIVNKVKPKILEENQKLSQENEMLNNIKNKFSDDNQKIQNVLNNQGQINNKFNDDIAKIENVIKNVQDYNYKNQNQQLTSENCVNYINVQDPSAIRIIADEANLEELILTIKKGFEKKRISFSDAISFIRNTSRDLYTAKILRNKVVKKY